MLINLTPHTVNVQIDGENVEFPPSGVVARVATMELDTGETALNLMLMRQIDEQFLETPFFGVRQMTWHLRNEGHLVNEKRIRRLMRLMGLMPIYQKPNTSKAAKGHKTYPYLLKGLRVTRPNQVWAADITYLPMRRGFLYLVAIMDGIRWGARASLTVEIMNGAMVRVILPNGVRITHEWDDARKADPAIKAALEAIADARADMTTAEGAGDD